MKPATAYTDSSSRSVRMPDRRADSGVVTDGEDVAAPRGVAQDVHHHAIGDQHAHRAQREAGAEELDGLTRQDEDAGPCPTPRTVALPETYRSSAKKMLSVPRVTMNGGIRNRVMSQPLSRPQAVPKANPRSERQAAGHARTRR